jgi:hypothetical protein
MGWATVEQAYDWTGEEPSPKALALAQTMIEIFSGTTTIASDDGLISGRNLRLLGQAVAFQAVWLDEHPDVLAAMDVEGVSQDGLNANYASVNAHLLAPMAARCLRRLSWTQEIRIRLSRAARRSDRGNRDSAVRDDQYEWSSLPFGHVPGPGQR